MPELIPMLNREAIGRITADVAQRIALDYRDRHPVLIGVLKGAFVFTADLIRQMRIPVTVDFIRASSYGAGTTSSGKIRMDGGGAIDIRGKDVIIVEDIVDTGLTLSRIVDHFRSMDPASLRVCALIDKHERRQRDVTVDYPGHRIDKGFLVGYGLDCDEAYRELPEIYHLKF